MFDRLFFFLGVNIANNIFVSFLFSSHDYLFVDINILLWIYFVVVFVWSFVPCSLSSLKAKFAVNKKLDIREKKKDLIMFLHVG